MAATNRLLFITRAQFTLALIASLLAFQVVGPKASLAVFGGGLASLLPQWSFYVCSVKLAATNPKDIVRRLYQAEILKFGCLVLLLSAFLNFYPNAAAWVISMFVANEILRFLLNWTALRKVVVS